MVRKEIWAHALAYNLIRTVMAQAAATHEVLPRSLSFKGALQQPLGVVALNQADYQTICQKCLQKDPSNRYISAAAVAEDLRRYRQGEPIAARPVGLPECAVNSVRRRPTVKAFLWLSLLAACVALILWLFWRQWR
jgi:hypothetical protein